VDADKNIKNRCGNEEKKSPIVKGSVDNFLENLKLVVDGIATIFGKNCEVVLHDLRSPDRSIVAIANGHVTGRKIGDSVIGAPLRDKGLKAIIEQNKTQSIVSNYITHTRDGRRLKSTTIVFRNQKGMPKIGLCINLDLTEFTRANELLDKICMNTKKIRPEKPGSEYEEQDKPGQDVATIMQGIVEEAISGIQEPFRLAEKAEKIKVIKTMRERGLFLLKGGVDYAAGAVGISRFTVYNYLKELQYRKDNNGWSNKRE